MAFHRTYVVRVNAHGGGGGVVFEGDDVFVSPKTDPNAPTIDALDLGLDAIAKKTSRRILTVFLIREDEETGNRWYGVVTVPTL